MLLTSISCDIFCTIVDNFGDAGVSWRLARQLAAEHGWQVRLWIDKPEVLSTLAKIDPHAPRQQVDGVRVEHWPSGADVDQAPEIADVVIEAFACHPPAA